MGLYVRFYQLTIANSFATRMMYIDDERQFKTAKHSQAPGDATVLKRFPR